MRSLLALALASLWLLASAVAQEPAAEDAVPPAAPAAAFRTKQPVPPVAFTPTPIPSSQLAPMLGEKPLGADAYRAPSGGLGQLAGYLVLLLALFAGGLWIMRNGVPKFRIGAKGEQRLHIQETRSLGNRQFLVVAEYDGHKVLLGVCPGRIDHLCGLPAVAPAFPPIAPEVES